MKTWMLLALLAASAGCDLAADQCSAGDACPPALDRYAGTWTLTLAPVGTPSACPAFDDTRVLSLDVSLPPDGNGLVLVPEGDPARHTAATLARFPPGADLHVTFELLDVWGTIDDVPVRPLVRYDLHVDTDGAIIGSAETSFPWDNIAPSCSFHYEVLGKLDRSTN